MSSSSPKIIVGLGNPGRVYGRTRHNLGFWVLDLLAGKLDAPWTRTACKAVLAETAYGPWRLTLAKPMTFMNLSGESVRQLLTQKQALPEDLLVVCDDVNLPVGRIRIRREGGAGGHHGLESIIESVGAQAFPRMRLGIQPLEQPLPENLESFVLEPFKKGEEAVVAETARRAVDAILTLLDEGLEAAMNRFNE